MAGNFHPCPFCPEDFTTAESLGEHRKMCLPPVASPEPTKRKNTGSSLEKLVRESVKALKPHGLSLVQASVRTVGRHLKGGRFVGQAIGKGALDFSGDLNGLAVYFDAKSTSKISLSLDEERSLKPHQVKRVREAHERGSAGFFLVEFSACAGGPRYFVLTWPVLKSFWDRRDVPGAPKSIPFATFLGHCPEIQRAGRVLDLIAAVKAVVARRDGGAA